MPFAALTGRISPEHQGALLSKLADTPVPPHSDMDGMRVSGVTSFLSGSLLVRVVQYDSPSGDSLASVHQRIAGLLPDLPDPGFQPRFMHRVQQRIVREAPHASLAAIRYQVRAGFEDRITEVFTGVRPEARPVLRDERGATNGGVLHGVAVFVSGTDMVRVVSYTGDLADVIRYMATRPGRREIEQRLAPYLSEGSLVDGTPEEYTRRVHQQLMPAVSRHAPVG